MSSTISTSPVPAYSRLQQELTRKITSGFWNPGDQLPTERQLAEEYNLSVGTVRNAMAQLVHAGYCYRAQGKGTFVSEYPTDQAVFYRMRSSLAGKEAAILPTNIQLDEVPAPAEAAEALRLRSGSHCIRISRGLRGRDELGIFPMGWTISYFSPELCSRLLNVDMTVFLKTSLYHLVETECQVPSVFCDELIQICTHLPLKVQQFLERPEKTPCFDMRMISYTYSRIPFEYRQSWVLSEFRGLIRKHDFRQ